MGGDLGLTLGDLDNADVGDAAILGAVKEDLEGGGGELVGALEEGDDEGVGVADGDDSDGDNSRAGAGLNERGGDGHRGAAGREEVEASGGELVDAALGGELAELLVDGIVGAARGSSVGGINEGGGLGEGLGADVEGDGGLKDVGVDAVEGLDGGVDGAELVGDGDVSEGEGEGGEGGGGEVSLSAGAESGGLVGGDGVVDGGGAGAGDGGSGGGLGGHLDELGAAEATGEDDVLAVDDVGGVGHLDGLLQHSLELVDEAAVADGHIELDARHGVPVVNAVAEGLDVEGGGGGHGEGLAGGLDDEGDLAHGAAVLGGADAGLAEEGLGALLSEVLVKEDTASVEAVAVADEAEDATLEAEDGDGEDVGAPVNDEDVGAVTEHEGISAGASAANVADGLGEDGRDVVVDDTDLLGEAGALEGGADNVELHVARDGHAEGRDGAAAAGAIDSLGLKVGQEAVHNLGGGVGVGLVVIILGLAGEDGGEDAVAVDGGEDDALVAGGLIGDHLDVALRLEAALVNDDGGEEGEEVGDGLGGLADEGGAGGVTVEDLTVDEGGVGGGGAVAISVGVHLRDTGGVGDGNDAELGADRDTDGARGHYEELFLFSVGFKNCIF